MVKNIGPRVIILGLFFLFHRPSFARVLAPDRPSYYRFESSSDFEWVFPKEKEKLARELEKKIQGLVKIYENEFQWELDEETKIVLSGQNNEIVNGFATLFPNNLSVFFSGGHTDLERFASRSWYDLLLIHELAHMYQLNPKQGIGKFFGYAFGNNPFLLPIFPFYIIPAPNVTLPRAFLEGNAVWNESRFGLGGRLWSGQAKALVSELIFAGKVDRKFFYNSHLYFPFGQEKYLIGGFFFSFLEKKYGASKVNGWFFDHSKRYWNPLGIENSFEGYFGTSFEVLFDDFIKDWKNQNSGRKSLTRGRPDTLFVSPFYREGKSVTTLSYDGRSFPIVYEWNVESGAIVNKKRVDLPTGRVFKFEGQYWSSGQREYNGLQSRFSLWGKSGKTKKEFLSKEFLARWKDKWLTLDLKKTNYRSPKIFLGDEYKGICHSRAIIDDKGRVWCFRQQGAKRSAYRDGKKMFSYDGYYGYPVDFRSGHLYYIASTKLGSGLYRHQGSKAYLVLDSDNIVEASISSNEKFAIIAEVSEEGYNYARVALRPFAATPDFTAPIISKLELKKRKGEAKHEHETKSYFSPFRLRASAWPIAFSQTDSKGDELQILATFVDPLDTQSFAIGAARRSRFDEKVGIFSYSNQATRADFSVSYEYSYSNEIKKKTHDLEAALSVPVWTKGDYALSPFVTYDYEYFSYLRLKHNYAYRGGLHLGLFRKRPLSPFAVVDFDAAMAFEQNRFDEKTYLASASWQGSWPQEWSLTAEAEFVKTQSFFWDVGEFYQKLPQYGRSYLSVGDFSYAQFGVGVSKNINRGFYFSTAPLSLRQWSPGVFAQRVVGDYEESFYGAQLNAQWIVLFNFPFNTKLSYIKSESSERYLFQLGAPF